MIIDTIDFLSDIFYLILPFLIYKKYGKKATLRTVLVMFPLALILSAMNFNSLLIYAIIVTLIAITIKLARNDTDPDGKNDNLTIFLKLLLSPTLSSNKTKNVTRNQIEAISVKLKNNHGFYVYSNGKIVASISNPTLIFASSNGYDRVATFDKQNNIKIWKFEKNRIIPYKGMIYKSPSSLSLSGYKMTVYYEDNTKKEYDIS